MKLLPKRSPMLGEVDEAGRRLAQPDDPGFDLDGPDLPDADDECFDDVGRLTRWLRTWRPSKPTTH